MICMEKNMTTIKSMSTDAYHGSREQATESIGFMVRIAYLEMETWRMADNCRDRLSCSQIFDVEIIFLEYG